MSIFFWACQSNQQKSHTKREAFNHSEINSTILRDTAIIYALEGISLEGAEAKVFYSKGKIQKADISIYGETGQCQINYVFQDKVIETNEKCYDYSEGVMSVEKYGMTLASSIQYVIDYDGKPIGKDPLERVSIYQEFKKAVPFVLN